MTKYLRSDPFSVAMNGEKYANGWDAVFRCEATTDVGGEMLNGVVAPYRCTLRRNHDGPHCCGDYEW